MKNITVSIDDETYRQARIRAAEQNTSVSALVREFLEGIVSRWRSADSAADELFDVLDRGVSYRASNRMTREESHER